MFDCLKRLRKILGFGNNFKKQSSVPTKVIDGGPEGNFRAFADGVKDVKVNSLNTSWNSQPAEIHIGLDFGTSFTKACLYFLDKEQRHIIYWKEQGNENPSYFLPSRLWLDSENILHMANPQKKQWREIRYFKMAVAGQYIGPKVVPDVVNLTSDPYRIYSAFYLAQCFDWIEQQAVAIESKYLKNRDIVWSGNLGVPISYFDNQVSDYYQELLTVARFMQKRVSDSEPLERLDALYQQALQEPSVSTFLTVPELYAEACGIFSDYHTPEGYYTLFDIGGGTVDGAVMRFERVAGAPQVNFLTASVEPLGAEIIASCNGNSSESDKLKSKLSCQTAELIFGAKQKSQIDWCEQQYLPIKMCGGGHSSIWHVNTIADTYSTHQHYNCGIPVYRIEDIQVGKMGVEGILPGDELRLLIAVGLSIPKGEGPSILGFPSENPRIVIEKEEGRINLDERQRDLYGDDN